MFEELLSVRDLKTSINTTTGLVKAVDGVTFTIGRGEISGLVGESGCGKTMTALSIMRLLPEPHARIQSGEVMFEGRNLVPLSEDEMRAVRGNRISMIFQDPMTALNPIMKTGEQIAETIVAHRNADREDAWNSALELLESVGIPDANLRARQYPFQMSGGMRQRVMIASALSCTPSLLIADEPTTNLDVSIQAQILELLKSIRDRTGTTILLITHNLGIVAWLCDRIHVMYAGKIVEEGPTDKILEQPAHPYTALLLKSIPQVGAPRDRLETIPGDVPDLSRLPVGCRFNPRCPHQKEVCRTIEPEMTLAGPDRTLRCHMYDQKYKENW